MLNTRNCREQLTEVLVTALWYVQPSEEMWQTKADSSVKIHSSVFSFSSTLQWNSYSFSPPDRGSINRSINRELHILDNFKNERKRFLVVLHHLGTEGVLEIKKYLMKTRLRDWLEQMKCFWDRRSVECNIMYTFVNRALLVMGACWNLVRQGYAWCRLHCVFSSSCLQL